MNNQHGKNQIERCDCGIPVVKRLNSRKLEFVKYSNGQPLKLTAEYSGDKSVVRCEKCGRNITFMTNEVKLGLNYAIASPKK